ncbi:MAG: tRNA lysidine(34) synthetase TilS [Angelakisella sp.]|jgi:tRNA(Ile)-lysidine synthase|nr:tRNA lysidine(34) synthetase TilS [Angelakisella sp.]
MPTPSPLRAKALEAVERYQMIQPGDTVAAGVSGGADSVALLDFLRHLRRSVPFTLLVCHLDHQLRGEESRRDAAFVRELAERWGLPYRCRQADAAAWARLHRLTVEEAGRQLRYAFFQECAGETGKIATAHTLSDSMETVLLNLCRGTGPRGLRGIPPVRGNIIRPLFACTRREVENYCQERGLAFVTDSTNLLPDYSRNRIRLEVLPRLELLNPALPAAFARFMDRMADQWALTRQLAEEARETIRRPDGRLDRQGLLSLPPPVREAILLELLETAGKQSARLVEEMERAARRGSGEVQLGDGIFFTVRGETAGLIARRPEPDGTGPLEVELDPLALPLPAFFPLGGGRTLRIAPAEGKKEKLAEKINKSALKNCLDCGRIKGTVILRRKQPGDRMAPAWRRAGSHPLKKLCQEAGVPPEKRGMLVVAQDAEGIIWAEGFGADRRCAWREDSRLGCVWEVITEGNDDEG